MSDPVGQAWMARFKRRRRLAAIAGIATLVVGTLLIYQMGNDTLKSYAFLIGVWPALAVYFFVGYYGLKPPKI